ncbi:MFS transporter [Cohnella thailandensis]|uniref:MFS transporter n=1 Tax=Cohnella thailandensis TaxID=557557 RepID=A0A841SRR6_9BACL|nr:MFS transporter [Cohnella thailandensis]MBB6635073.1 MFS transporter [Cohnella thailandensis]MBP1977864.1 DHA1 family inner membrane transport protein [Cohnella thailandensis]
MINDMAKMTARRRKTALVLLTLAIFAVGTAELLPMGLLLPISSDTGVSISVAGMLVTGYALGVVFGGPVLSAMSGRLPRRTVMNAFMVLFIVGSVVCAVAPSYGVLLAGRIVSSLAHGTLFGAIVVTAKDLAEPGKEGRSIAWVGSGLTVAVILGAPLGTFLGQQFGWRIPFLVIALLAAAAWVGMLRGIPPLPRVEGVASLRKQISIVSRPAFMLVLLITVFGTGGTFAGFTYITPILERITGFSSDSVTIVLLVFGAGSILGNLAGGRWADKKLLPTLFGGMLLLAASLAIFTWTNEFKPAAVVSVFVWGFASYSIIAPLNIRVLQKAGEAQELASALNISAFNMGNALGAFVGGLAIDSSLGLASVPWVASLIVIVGLVLTVWSAALERQERRSACGRQSDRTISQSNPKGDLNVQ